MFRRFFTVIVLGLFLALNMNFAYAQELDKNAQQGLILVSGTYSEDFPPDIAYITLSITTNAKTANEADSQNRDKANKVFNKISKILDTTKGDSVKTSSYSISPLYDYNNITRTSELAGYKATNQILITTKQINNTGRIIDEVVASGANQIDSVNFGIFSNTAYCQKVITQAADNAKNTANTLAQALGVKITGIKQATSFCSPNLIQPVFKSMLNRNIIGAEMPSTPIEAGNIKINGNVNIEFFINK